MKKPYIIAADKHIEAAQNKKWDYPQGSKFENREAVIAALREGKTIEDVYYEVIARFGSVTGALMNSVFQHVSASTKTAVRKGMKILLENRNLFETHT